MSFKQETIVIQNNIIAYDVLVKLIELSKRLLMVDGPRVLNDIAAMNGYLDSCKEINKVTLSNCPNNHYCLIVSTTSRDMIEGEDVVGNMYVTYDCRRDRFDLEF
jgi:hypothetical protein